MESELRTVLGELLTLPGTRLLISDIDGQHSGLLCGTLITR
jgi:hypothetical protein